MDNTAMLQKMLDKGGFVQIPDGFYEVRKTLEVGDNTHVFCSPRTHIRLADHANCPILANKEKKKGEKTVGVTVEGGIWDGNNLGQVRAEYTGRFAHSKGELFSFFDMKKFTVRSLTIKDANSYGLTITDTEDFTFEDIFFDCNNKTLNMDGIHINGYANEGYLHNIKGNTNDDMIALNSDEGLFYTENNDITNITIDGIYGGDDGWTAVRLLSRKAHVRNIVIRNIYGAYKFNLVSFTHWAQNDPTQTDLGFFENIVIENVFGTSCRKSGSGHGGLIWFQDGVEHVGNVVIRNMMRTEGLEMLNSTHGIDIGAGVKIKRLIMENIWQDIPDDKPLIWAGHDAEIGEFKMDGQDLNLADYITY